MRKGLAAWVLAAALLAARAAAAEDDLLTRARALVAEAKPLVARANDVDLSMEERRAPRKQAFVKLKEARDLYDRYLEANPAMEGKLEAECVEMHGVLQGIKKDSALGELEKEEPPPDLAAPAPAPGAAPAPAPDPSERARAQLASIEAYEKDHPGDLPLLQACYEKFLADFPDPSTPEYARAADKLGRITDRLKGAFQNVARRDWDSHGAVDSRNTPKVIGRLSQDFNAKDADTRRRAARLLAATRSGAATWYLAKGLADKDADLARISRDGLVAIGGTRAAENLVKLYRDASAERQRAAFDVLCAVAAKGPVEAATVSVALGRFALSSDADVAQAAIDALARLGKPGGPGLVEALATRLPLKKVYVIGKIGEARYYRATPTLGQYLVWTRDGAVAQFRAASMQAIESMGAGAVPYLIPMLQGSQRQYALEVVRAITGREFEASDVREIRAWYESNRPSDAD